MRYRFRSLLFMLGTLMLPLSAAQAQTVTTWLGNTPGFPTDWNVPSNWDNGVPTFATDAVIPPARLRYPVILDTVTAEVRTLTLMAGTSLILNDNGRLELKGDFVNHGAYNSGGGMVILSGPTQQNVGGSRLTRIVRLTVGPAGARLVGDAEIRQLLVLNGNLDTNGQSFLLWADFIGGLPDGTATVVNNGGVVQGTVRVMRYINPSSNSGIGYRHMSSPVVGSTVADLAVSGANGFQPIVNPAYNAIPRPFIPADQFPNVFGFNEQRGGPNASFVTGYFSPASVTDPLVLGRGYTVKMRALTPDFIGTLYNGDLTITGLTRTGTNLSSTAKPGWHLLGNPYPSPLDWDLVPVPAGMSNAISVFRSTGPDAGVYMTRVSDGLGTGTGTLPDGIIPTAQGFFARVTGQGPVDFTFPNAARVTVFAPAIHYRAAPETRPLVRLALRAANETNPDAQGSAQVYFTDEAHEQADDAFDGAAPAHNVGVPTLVALAGTDELTVDGLPTTALAGGTTVELLCDLPAAGAYEIGVDALANLADAVLLDRLTGTRYDLTQQRKLMFRVLQEGELRGRFALQFGQRTLGTAGPQETKVLTLAPNPAHGVVRVSGLGDARLVQLFDVVGRVVRRLPVAAGDDAVLLDLGSLLPGVYSVRAGAASQRLVVE